MAVSKEQKKLFGDKIKPYKAFLARKEAPAEEPAAEPEDLVLLREIRDALRTR